MPNTGYTTIRGHVCKMSEKSPSEILEDSFIAFLDWGFADKAGVIQVPNGELDCNGNKMGQLKLKHDPTGRCPQAWVSKNKNWVYETGLSCGEPLPVEIYVDGQLDSSAQIDYNNGQIHFDPPISEGADVCAQYSYKWIDVTTFDNVPHFRTFAKNSHSEAQWDSETKGKYHLDKDTQICLPSVMVEVSPLRGTKAVELGSNRRYAEYAANFCIFAESKNVAKRIADVISDLQDDDYLLIDTELLSTEKCDLMPLNSDGTIKSGLNYSELAEQCPWRCALIKDARSQNGSYICSTLYKITVQATLETILCNCS